MISTTTVKDILTSFSNILSKVNSQLSTVVSSYNKNSAQGRASISLAQTNIINTLNEAKDYFDSRLPLENQVIKNMGLLPFIPNQYMVHINKQIVSALSQNNLEKELSIFKTEETRIRTILLRVQDLLRLLPLMEDVEDKENKLTIGDNEVMLKLYFQRKSNPDSFTKLKEMAEKWEIVFQLLNDIYGDDDTREVPVLGYESGSLIAVAGTITSVATILGKIIKFALEQKKVLLEIKELEERLEKISIEKEVMHEFNGLLKKMKDEKNEKLSKTIYDKLENEEVTEEQEVQLTKKIIPEILDFIEHDGKIELVDANEKADLVEVEILKTTFSEIEELEKSYGKIESIYGSKKVEIEEK